MGHSSCQFLRLLQFKFPTQSINKTIMTFLLLTVATNMWFLELSSEHYQCQLLAHRLCARLPSTTIITMTF